MNAPIRTPFDPPEIGGLVEIAEGAFWTRMPLSKPLEHVNVYIFEGDEGWSIVDTGVDTKTTRGLWQALLDGPLAAHPVHQVIATHHHLDHIGLAGWFMQAHGARLVTTRTAYLMARMLKLDVQETPPEPLLAFWRSCGMDPEIYAERASSRPFNTADFVADIPLGYLRIQDGDSIDFGRRRWRVRTGDGHAPEHATFWSEDDDLVLGGDQLLGSISPNIGTHATEPLGSSVKDWLESCEKFQAYAEERHIVLPGHRLPFTGLPARLKQLIAGHDGALTRLKAALAEPKTAVECFDALFKRSIKSGEYGLAMVEAMAHCRYLEAEGLAMSHERDDGALVWQIRG